MAVFVLYTMVYYIVLNRKYEMRILIFTKGFAKALCESLCGRLCGSVEWGPRDASLRAARIVRRCAHLVDHVREL